MVKPIDKAARQVMRLSAPTFPEAALVGDLTLVFVVHLIRVKKRKLVRSLYRFGRAYWHWYWLPRVEEDLDGSNASEVLQKIQAAQELRNARYSVRCIWNCYGYENEI